jgi:hypothetical protein
VRTRGRSCWLGQRRRRGTDDPRTEAREPTKLVDVARDGQEALDYLVATIKAINGQIKQLQPQIATARREHPDGAIFLSLFKKPSGVICAAELLAEIRDCRARYLSRAAGGSTKMLVVMPKREPRTC